jgi:hypothetical protein
MSDTASSPGTMRGWAIANIRIYEYVGSDWSDLIYMLIVQYGPLPRYFVKGVPLHIILRGITAIQSLGTMTTTSFSGDACLMRPSATAWRSMRTCS